MLLLSKLGKQRLGGTTRLPKCHIWAVMETEFIRSSGSKVHFFKSNALGCFNVKKYSVLTEFQIVEKK